MTTNEAREALMKKLADELEYRVRTAVALSKGGHDHRAQVTDGREAVAHILAAAPDHQAEAPKTCSCSCHTMGGSHVTPCCTQAEAPSDAVRGVQTWMADDLHTALGNAPVTEENAGERSWADWWSRLLVQVRAVRAESARVSHAHAVEAALAAAPDHQAEAVEHWAATRGDNWGYFRVEGGRLDGRYVANAPNGDRDPRDWATLDLAIQATRADHQAEAPSDDAETEYVCGNCNAGIPDDHMGPRAERALRARIAQGIRDYWDANGDIIDTHNGARLAFDAVAARIEEEVSS